MSDISVNWFEIPAADTTRAAAFYGKVLGRELGDIDGPDGPMKVFMGAEGPAGALVNGDAAASTAGIKIFLNCPDIEAALGRVKGAGGKVLQEKTSIGPFGFIASLQDTEGNKVSLHYTE